MGMCGNQLKADQEGLVLITVNNNPMFETPLRHSFFFSSVIHPLTVSPCLMRTAKEWHGAVAGGEITLFHKTICSKNICFTLYAKHYY